jgi:hypothetical protein
MHMLLPAGGWWPTGHRVLGSGGKGQHLITDRQGGRESEQGRGLREKGRERGDSEQIGCCGSVRFGSRAAGTAVQKPAWLLGLAGRGWVCPQTLLALPFNPCLPKSLSQEASPTLFLLT